jgi:hypothetical protein
LPETVSPAQGVLMELTNNVFTDYEKLMVIFYDNILMYANAMDVTYEALKAVLQQTHDFNMALMMSKT